MIRNIIIFVLNILEVSTDYIFNFIDVILGTKYVVIDGCKIPKTGLDFIFYCVNFVLTMIIILIIFISLCCTIKFIYDYIKGRWSQ